ncbi:3-phosphoshikimate 1-carboxyvinyltransferase [Thiotrichales bacterium 19S3-7]|nr:3-phosphoshikimate 1-carboxyvinyltransferase [Thiotrichales bacterium 19S3-7]MCF6801087.1 3-phosphoshikimate 1-carboxyvinyltransferase [Thiotrichales bacterium 19S3-11]
MKEVILPVKHPVKGIVSLPGSKSLVNRVLILAALADGQSIISNMLFSDDSIACLNALKALGIVMDIDQAKREVQVIGCNHQFNVNLANVYCHDSGTVTRFLLPVCAAMKELKFHFSASKRMSQRPLLSLLEVLIEQGCRIDYETHRHQMPFYLNANGLIGGDIFIPSVESSQFLSGLLMASPLASNDVLIHTKAHKQLTYVDMTVDVMQHFGVAVERVLTQDSYRIKAHQHYQGQNYTLEPDISTASYFAAAAALTNGHVLLEHVHENTLQGDIQFLNLLEQMGCHVEYHHQGVTVTGAKQLKGVNVNMATFSDTFMTLAAIASFAQTKTQITGIGHTRLQESDRILAISTELKKLGAKLETTNDSITIYPSELHGAIVSGCGDHRIAMSLSLIGLRVAGVEITDSQCVAKTCPDYFHRLRRLTGES